VLGEPIVLLLRVDRVARREAGGHGGGIEAGGPQLRRRGAPGGFEPAEVLFELRDAHAADARHLAEGDPVLTFYCVHRLTIGPDGAAG